MAVPEASHTFEAYTSFRTDFEKSKTADDWPDHRARAGGRSSANADRFGTQKNLAATLREKDRRDPLWLKRLIAAHVNEIFAILAADSGIGRFSLSATRPNQGLSKNHVLAVRPLCGAGFVVSMAGCYMAKHGFFEAGSEHRLLAARKIGGAQIAAHPAFAISCRNTKTLFGLTALPAMMLGAIILACVSRRLRDLFFFLLVVFAILNDHLCVNFVSREWYRGTTRWCRIGVVGRAGGGRVFPGSLLRPAPGYARDGIGRQVWDCCFYIFSMPVSRWRFLIRNFSDFLSFRK